MKVAAGRLAVAVVALCAASCRTLPFPDPHLEGDYGKALKRWTRTVALYSGLETRAFVRMVYLSPEFIAAQAQEQSKMRAELPDQAAETLARMREEYRQPTFFAITYLPDRTANDWNEPGSVWRIALNLGFGERPPDRIVRYDRPFSAELRALYPYLDEYSIAYLIRFPETTAAVPEPKAAAQVPPAQGAAAQAPAAPVPAARPLEAFIPAETHVVVAGALGKMTFNWRLNGDPDRPLRSEAGAEDKPSLPNAR